MPNPSSPIPGKSIPLPSNSDPKRVIDRLYNQVSRMLEILETDPEVTVRERVAALAAIGRVQGMIIDMWKETVNDPERGSAVRKYAAAFQADGASRRKQVTRDETGESDIDLDGI